MRYLAVLLLLFTACTPQTKTATEPEPVKPAQTVYAVVTVQDSVTTVRVETEVVLESLYLYLGGNGIRTDNERCTTTLAVVTEIQCLFEDVSEPVTVEVRGTLTNEPDELYGVTLSPDYVVCLEGRGWNKESGKCLNL